MTSSAKNTGPPAPIVCLGAATWDLVFSVTQFPSHPSKVIANRFSEGASGMATSAAITIATLGNPARLCARVGDDALGRKFAAAVRERGVDTEFVQFVEGAQTPVSSVIIDAQGERLICPYFDSALGAASTPPMEVLDAAAGVLVDVRWPSAAGHLLTQARSAGVVTLLDADVAEQHAYEELVPHADHVIFSADGLRAFSGTTSVSQGLRHAREATNATLGVTIGGDGCVFEMPDGLCHYATLPVESVDTLAAGDTFHGAYLARYVETQNLEDAIRFANAAAALKCTKFGGNAGTPTRAEVLAAMAGLPPRRPWTGDGGAT